MGENTQPPSRYEFDDLRREVEVFKSEVLSRVDKLTADVGKDHDNYLEWKGRALLMLYVIPGLTAVIGFLLERALRL